MDSKNRGPGPQPREPRKGPGPQGGGSRPGSPGGNEPRSNGRYVNVWALLKRLLAFARRRIRWILAAGVLLLLTLIILLGFILAGRLSRRVTGILIDGESPYTPSELTEASGIVMGQRTVMVNEKKAARKLLRSFDYLDEVTVTVSREGLVTITVRQVEAIFLLRAADKCFALSADLTVLEMADSPEGLYDQTLIELTLPNPRKVLVGRVVEYGDAFDRAAVEAIMALFIPGELEGVSRLDLADRYRLGVVLDDRFDVMLGDWEDLPRKLALLIQIIQDPAYAGAARVEVDVSNPQVCWTRILEEQEPTDPADEPESEPIFG